MNVYHLLLVCDKQSVVVELLFLHVGIPGNRFDSFPEGNSISLELFISHNPKHNIAMIF